MTRPRIVRPDELGEGQYTPGMRRLEAFAAPGIWSGQVHTEPGMVSGWHHHGEHDTYAYCVSGAFRLESGSGGRNVLEAAPGDFVLIPRQTVHRESNPSDEEAVIVLFRVGSGEVVVNVDGPDPV